MPRALIAILRITLRTTLVALFINYVGGIYANGIFVSYKPISTHYLEQPIFDLTNSVRQEIGARTLIYDDQLALSARQHAHEMAQLSYVSHESPIAENFTLEHRIIRAGSIAQLIGENLARLNDIGNVPEQVIQGWLDSPGHRKNLLHPRFTHMGIGVAQGSDGLFYIVQTLAYQPLTLQNSRIDNQVLDVYEVNAKFSLNARQEVAILYGSQNTKAEVLDAGHYSQIIYLNSAAPVQLALGVRSTGGSFIFQDDGWLEPTNTYQQWKAGNSGAKTYAQFENVTVQKKQESNNLVTLYFDKVPNVDYGVWVNDDWQEVTFKGTSISIYIPTYLVNPIIELGLYKGNDLYEPVMRLTLSVRGGRIVLEPTLQ